MDRPKLGQECSVSGVVIKTRSKLEALVTHFNKYPFKTRWVNNSTDSTRAVYIGWRTVFEGTTRWESDYDERYPNSGMPVFTPIRSLEVWLFVTDERSNPFYVLPEDVTFIK